MTMTVSAAKITTEAGHTWWRCPNCDAKQAEIIGRRVVILAKDRRISLPADVEQDQVCWKCGTTSILEGQQS